MPDAISRGHVIREIFLWWVEGEEKATPPHVEEAELLRLSRESDKLLEEEWAAKVGEYAGACGFDPNEGWAKVSRGEPTSYSFLATVDGGFVDRYMNRVVS